MSMWHCAGCDAGYRESDADCIVDHVRDCDYVDGAGEPIDVTVKFSVVHWYIATVRSDALAAVTGGLPLTALRGPVEDGFENEDTEYAVAEFLDELTQADGPDESDGFEIGDVYPASRDRTTTN